MTDRLIIWYYGFLAERFGIKDHHDKWLHFTLIFIWSILFTSLSFTWFSFVSSQILIFGREIYNVYERLKDGYDLKPAFKNGFSLMDIAAGEAGLVASFLLFNLVATLFGG